MKHVPLATLEDRIVRPGFDKHLKPLLMYKGRLTLGRAHRLWNMMVSAMEHEATVTDITQRLTMNPDHSQLCGPERAVQYTTLRSFCGRLLDNPKVTGEMPHLQEYVEWLLPPHKGAIFLQPVAEITHHRRNSGAGGWRIFVDRRTRAYRGDRRKPKRKAERRSEPLVYPFLIHDAGKPEHILLRKVNDSVARHIPPHMRADICQDLIVGILSGDFDADNLTLPAIEARKRIMAFCQNKYTEVSLFDAVPGAGGIRYVDVFSEEDSLWDKI